MYFSKKRRFFAKPKKKEVPELWLRSLLVAASAWVSFAHGSNDGQKGVGLVMLILISLIPASFALNPEISRESIRADIRGLQENFSDPSWAAYPQTPAIQQKIDSLSLLLDDVQAPATKIRAEILHLQKDIKNIQNLSFVPQAGANFDATSLSQHTKNLYDTIDYAPWWVIALISISLGIGTMFGWKRIVKTLGKKIGNHKMSYAESTSSALITAITITVASRFGLPVSTTHIFSSSIAGCMMTGKKPGLQHDTVKHILMAWLLTLPITICLSAVLFSLLWLLIL